MIFEKIVVIDDDHRVIKSIKLALTEYEIIDFSSGEKALEFFRRPHDVSLVLLDVMMPGMNGLNVLYEIKKLNKDITVIIMTAYGSQDIAIQALRNRADDFMEKPFTIDDLKDKIKSHLRERGDVFTAGRDQNDQVDRIKRFIDRNLSNVSLEYIAEEMCLSPKYVSRMFNKISGSSFRNYKVKMKIDLAQSLLKKTLLSINKIAYDLGYQNPESFMRIFKRMTKYTPTQYRKKYAAKNSRYRWTSGVYPQA
jgi:YesN/AraC family two-component response regulator